MPPRRRTAKSRQPKRSSKPEPAEIATENLESSTMTEDSEMLPGRGPEVTNEVGEQDPMEDENTNGENETIVQTKVSVEDRTEKLQLLRQRMRQSAQANRADLILESQKSKSLAKEVARLEKERKLNELLRLKAEADDRGEDLERAKNWQYTIEENDEWEKRLKRKKTRADFEFHDDAHAARRKYKKDLDQLKPDLEAYNAQKAAALGTISDIDSSQGSSVSVRQQLAVESLYRDANTLLYADNKPSEEAIDRVVSKLNMDLDKRSKRSRKRPNEDQGDITYINERNRVFNKKIARYYDKYTAEIRASFERGTAL
ncbi:hypothetical protein Clacol_008961 [Clathrus columnatus]|uniref:Pre-mRNA-splicing factor SYF2 n=1 Tax=Clathrus columnatus TaxID=1419009 RepID=A0AAV5APS1_9AGAM|nr:hypothetical protein Clacol_008961 [Clathrus columnatus]